MRRFHFDSLIIFCFFILLMVATHPVLGLGCGDSCGASRRGGDTDCSGCCSSNPPFPTPTVTDPACSASCVDNNGDGNFVCAWSKGDTCTNWCDSGPCLPGNCEGGYCKQQKCCRDYPEDLQVVSCSDACTGTCEDVSSCPIAPASGSCESPQLCCYETEPPLDCPGADNISLTQIGDNEWKLDWDKGGGSGKYTHMVFMDQDKSKTTACRDPSCFDGNTSEYKLEIPEKSGSPPNHGPIYIYNLVPNRVYYVQIESYYKSWDKGYNCQGGSPVVTSCKLSPNPLYIPVAGTTGELDSLTALYTQGSGVKRVKFHIMTGGNTYAIFPYGSDNVHYSDERNGYPQTYKTIVKGVAANGTNPITLHGDVYFLGQGTKVACRDVANVL